MYLKRLVEFSEKHPNLFPPIGYKRKKYQWIADMVDDELDFIPAIRGDQKALPDISRSSGIKPILLTDKAEYVFGFTESDASEKKQSRVKEQHHEYLMLLRKCVEETNDADIKQLYTILQKPTTNLPDKLKPSDIIIFRDNMETFLHDKESVKSFWENQLQPTADQHAETQCMICGTIGPVMERHTIEFPLGPERTKLISANQTAYESHGMKASSGSPVCYACEQKYGQALAHLLQRHTNTKQPGGPLMFRINDLTYVYWLRKEEQIQLNDFFSLTTSNEKEVQELLQSAFSGFKQENDLNDFSILTVSSSKARMVVRGYEENSLKNVQTNIERFFAAQDLHNQERFGVYKLASLMYNKPSTQMEKYAVAAWMEWFIRGRPLSTRVLVPLLKQIQAKGVMYPQHGAAIQSWLISQNKEEWNMTVNTHEKPYICGRLFAVLEKLQQEATNSKETIASRFFGSASTAPQSVFGLLIKNSQAHLNTVRKESKGKEIYYSNQIQHILEKLDSFPTVLSLKEQAEFALGYYHQKQDLYTKKEEKEVAK